MQGAASVTAGGALGGFASIVPHRPRAHRGVPRAPAGPGAFGRASRSAGSTTSIHGHRDRHRRESWDMGPLGGCSGLPGLRQTFPRPGGADPGYVEHRPVSGAGVRKLVAARYARFREFAPLRGPLRQEQSKAPYGGIRRGFTCFPTTPQTTPYICARQPVLRRPRRAPPPASLSGKHAHERQGKPRRRHHHNH